LGFVGVDGGVEFAAAVFPVILFVLTIIAYFLFVREIFIRKSKKSVMNANIIALISTFFMITIPIFLSRTVAGIPEKESAAFFFMFLTFYLFLKGWKSKGYLRVLIFGVLSGISSAMMALIWGGSLYIFITIGLASFIAFILNKFNKNRVLLYSSWIIASFTTVLMVPSRYTSVLKLFNSLSTGLASIVFVMILIDLILWNSKFKFIKKNKIPKNVISLIVTIVLLSVLASILFGPSFIVEKINAIHQNIFKPIFGRWNITVAENRQPYFTEWSSNFGPYVKNIPVFFWLFFAGSVVLFNKALQGIRKKDSWILTGSYILLFFGIAFSRYSGSSVFNGDNFISKSFYYVSVIIFVGILLYYLKEYYKRGDGSFSKIRYEYLLLFSLLMLVLFTVRGAVRLIMVLGPIAPIFVGFLIVESIDRFRRAKDDTWKMALGVIVVIILIASVFCFWNFYNTTKSQAFSFVPSSYNQQWQKAMEWVRTETPENAVFGHWWDYGYWVQSIGERATVLDGGNAIAYWNYLMGRVALTGDNQHDALEYLYNHNTTHFLIDSSDIGKYTAFSSIGSDEDYDRYSWFGTFLLDESQTQETKNQTSYIYTGGTVLDEDLIIEEDGKETLLPKQNAGVGAIVLPSSNGNVFLQPHVIMVYQGRQFKVDLKYLHINGKFYDFGKGIEAAAYVFPKIDQDGGGISKSDIGAALFISPRLFRGMLSQIYILEDPLERFPNFKLAYTESNLMIDSLRSQGMDLPEFVYFSGVQGPIKIWEIEYTGNEVVKDEYSDVDYRKYIDWKL